jgi:hypothetical protein
MKLVCSRMRWVEHRGCIGKNTNAQKISVGKPEGK